MRHTLNLINNGYKYILVRMIDIIVTSDIFLPLPFFFMPSLDVILFPGFMLRVSVQHMMSGLKVKGKLISLMFSWSLGKSLPM